MHNISVVTGLNYGDESKGLVSNALSDKNTLTILPSNSCQRAHTVVENGKRIVFRHFGSSTIKGAATYFTENFIINPAMFRKEYEELSKLGITPKVYARLGDFHVTPIDMFANVVIERSRGSESHSSTGCGVWETIRRNKVLQDQFKVYFDKDIVDYYKNHLILATGKPLSDEIQSFLNGKYLIQNCQSDFDFFINHVTIIDSDEEEKELLMSYPNIVFENGQGLLLTDEYSIDSKHNTPVYVGALTPAKMIAKQFTGEFYDLNLYYVSRTYYTRHGKGMIGVSSNCECSKEDINADMVDLTNVPNPHQGTLRYGKFTEKDAQIAVKRVDFDASRLLEIGMHVPVSRRNLVITHVNEYNDSILLSAACCSDNPKMNVFTSSDESTIKKYFSVE